jgi:hypothetical protein
MFDPLRAETIVMVTTGIQHAISEYQAIGAKMISKFEGQLVESIRCSSP